MLFLFTSGEMSGPLPIVSNRELLKHGKSTDTRKARLFTHLEFIVEACKRLMPMMSADCNRLDDYYYQYETVGPPREMGQDISEGLYPRFPTEDIFIAFVSACLGKMETEPSRFIDFQEYVWLKLQELQIAIYRKKTSRKRVANLRARHGF